jgi:hypothetical protein
MLLKENLQSCKENANFSCPVIGKAAPHTYFIYSVIEVTNIQLLFHSCHKNSRMSNSLSLI